MVYRSHRKKLAGNFSLIQLRTSDDEDVTIVSIASIAGSAEEGRHVSDLEKTPAFIRFLKPLGMITLMIVMAGLGALGSLRLQSGKSPVHEENHATAGNRLHSAGSSEQVSPSEKQLSESDPFSEESLGSTEPPVSDSANLHSHHSSSQEHDKPSTHQDGEPSTIPDVALTGSPATHVEGSDPKQIKEPSARVAPAPETSREDLITQQTVNFMAIADEDLASGNYVQAMRSYQTLRKKSQGHPGAALLFRLALCAEAAGRPSAAIEAYRKISGTHADAAWAGAARYGEARCLAAMQRHTGLQTDLLRRAVLDETEFLPTVRNEVLHLIGRDLWREQSTANSTDLLDDRSLTVPDWSADPARLLDELPLLIHETPSRSGPAEFQVLSVDEATPDGITLRLHCGMTSLEPLFTNLITGCRLKCQISEEARSLLKGRSQQIHVSGRTLAMLLDGLTICCGLGWRHHNSVVEILPAGEMSPEELRESRLAAAERILKLAVMEGPNSPQAGHSRLSLSSLLFERHLTADALQILQVQIESSPRSVVATEAAFNLGKCLMQLNRRDEARQAFLRSIDSSGGQANVKIASYIFHSRLLVEDDQLKLAVSSMMRGLSLSEGSPLEPFAALQLASIYLMLENPQGANTVLMTRRDELAAGPGRQGAAFLSALARFQAAVLSDRREREGAAVVSGLSEFKPEKYCGGHWAILVAEACEELGLTQQSADAWRLALDRLPASELRNKTIFRLASRYQADNQLEEARLLLATLTTSEADQMTQQARLRSAVLALEQGHPQDAIVACRQLIGSTKVPQIERAALRIMGQAFERQKNHQAAIYCFAGLLPDDATIDGSDGRPYHEATTGGRQQ